jgi:hypothetical protein
MFFWNKGKRLAKFIKKKNRVGQFINGKPAENRNKSPQRPTKTAVARANPAILATHTSFMKLKSAYAKQTTPRVETDDSESADKLRRGDAQDPRRRRTSPPERPLKVIVHRS